MAVLTRRQLLRALPYSFARSNTYSLLLQPQSQSYSTRSDTDTTESVPSDYSTAKPSTALVLATNALKIPTKKKDVPRWIAPDDDKLWAALSEHFSTRQNASLIDWQAISQSLLISRNPSALRARYLNAMANAHSRRRLGFIYKDLQCESGGSSLGGPRVGVRWSPEEDDALRTGVAIYGEGKWVLISAFVGTRTNLQCSNRWRCLNSPLSGEVLPVMHWARVMQKESRLKLLFNAGELSNSELSRRSAVVAAILKQQQDPPSLLDPGHDKRALSLGNERVRAATTKVDQLDGRALLEPFSPEEDEMIVRLVRLYGRRWTHIANLVSAARPKNPEQKDGQAQHKQKRTALGVKARFMALVRSHSNLTPPEACTSSLKVAENGESTAKRTIRAWTSNEDAELEAIVGSMVRDRAGFMSWTEVSRQLSTKRTPEQCRVRWTQHISTHIQHTPFTKAEDKLLWPFVVDTGQRPLASKGRIGYRGKAITIKYTNAKGSLTDVGMGWLGAGLMAGRATSALRLRVGRLQHVIEWMRKVAGIKDAHMHFDMVHRLANTPSDFRINAKKRPN